MVIVPVLALHVVEVELAVAVAGTPVPIDASLVITQPFWFFAVIVWLPILTGLNWFAVVNAPPSRLNV
jgi:hypothetical protein